jgi:hypothetical protein
MQRSYRSASGPQSSQKAEHRGSGVLAPGLLGGSPSRKRDVEATSGRASRGTTQPY